MRLGRLCLGSPGKSARRRESRGLAQSMTIWADLEIVGLVLARFGRKLFAYSHLFPSFATWYRAFDNKNIFWGVSRRLPPGDLAWRNTESSLKHCNSYINLHAEILF